jgi:hypothetical protein
MKSVGRPPVNAPYKVQRQNNQDGGKKLVFDCSWEVGQAPINTLVGVKAVSRVMVEGKTAEIKVFQVLDGQRISVDLIEAPVVENKISTHWRTKPAKSGNFEAGVYHFEVSVGGYTGETVKPLLLRDVMVNRNQSTFESAKAKPKVVF